MASAIHERANRRPRVESDAGSGGDEARARTLPRLISALVFAALVAVLPLAAAPYGSVEPWWTALFDALVFLLTTLWAVEGTLSGWWLTRSHIVILPILMLAGLALLQSVPFPSVGQISFDPYESRLVASRLLAIALYCALLIRYSETEARLRTLVYALVLVGFASTLFGMIRQTMQSPKEEEFVLAYLSPGSGYAQFINRNHFAYIAEMALGVLLGLIAGRGLSCAKAVAAIGIAIPLMAGLVLSNSRGGVFAMLSQVILLLAAFAMTRSSKIDGEHDRRRLSDNSPLNRVMRIVVIRAMLPVALLVTIVVGVVWIGGDTLADRVALIGKEVAADSHDTMRTLRKDIWAATWDMFEDNPVAGVGLGGFWIAYSRYHKGSGAMVAQQAHNDYLELLASGGVVGFAILILFIYLFSCRARARLHGGTRFMRAAALGALAGLFGVAVHSLFEFGLHVTVNALAAVALVAIASADVGPARESKN